MLNIEQHIFEITRLRKEADRYPEDNPSGLMHKIDLLAKCLVYIGRVSSHLDGHYKRVYSRRKYEQALAHTQATKHREASAEIAVRELREQEAQSYEDMQRWRNAFTSTNEEIHALKLKMRINFADGGEAYVQSGQRGAQATAPTQNAKTG